jgi:hypothetical protein
MRYNRRPVKRFGRILLGALTVVCAVLFVATVAAWARSPWAMHEVCYATDRWAVAAGNFRDGLSVYWDPAAQDDSEPRGFVHRRNQARTLSVDFGSPRFAWGVAVWTGPWPPPPGVAVSLPYWLLAVVIGTWPAARVIVRVRRRRAAPGLCPTCGYDLRATPERCPECGAVAPTSLRISEVRP